MYIHICIYIHTYTHMYTCMTYGTCAYGSSSQENKHFVERSSPFGGQTPLHLHPVAPTPWRLSLLGCHSKTNVQNHVRTQLLNTNGVTRSLCICKFCPETLQIFVIKENLCFFSLCYCIDMLKLMLSIANSVELVTDMFLTFAYQYQGDSVTPN